MNQLNRKRSLADVVGIEAWHDPFSKKEGRAKLFIDVVFGEARMGDGPGDLVQFRLALKRADVVVVIPVGEPLGVDPASVVRDAPRVEGAVRTREERNRKTGTDVSLAAGAKTDGLKAKVGLKAAARATNTLRQVVESEVELTGLDVKHMKNGEGQHRWIIAPGIGDVLDGRPWEGQKRRLVLVDQREDRTRGIAPTARIEVRCRREDFEITDIRLKDAKRWQALLKSTGQRNRMVAAEALIRTRLLQEGLLQTGADLGDNFLELTLADTVAEG